MRPDETPGVAAATEHQPRPPAASPAARCVQCGEPLPAPGADCVHCLLGSDSATHAEGDGEAAARATPIPHAPKTAFAPVSDASRCFGHYEIALRPDGRLWELGRGAMGMTYRALDTTLRCAVALKVIGASAAVHTGVRERFLREARAAAQLHHPNVASVFHFGVRPSDGQCFYAMELVEGETLDSRVKRHGPLPVDLALEVIAQVARALGAAEKSGLVHRDLKPSNLMLLAGDSAGGAEGMMVKVIDFGLAKAVAVAAGGGQEADLTHGEFVGTPAFASPEQFAGSTRGKLDVRSDIFSLGVTLWFLLTGKVPFPGRSLMEIHDRQVNQPLPRQHLAEVAVPEPVARLLRSMLAADLAQRPQSARDLAEAVRRCRDALAAASNRGRGLAAVAAGLLTLLGAGYFVVASNRPAADSPRSDEPATAAPAAATEKSIAVLPFENRSGDKEETTFFADGVQDEILTNLSRVADLKVISRTSVMPYRSDHSRNLREIGRALGVAHVLEGSVQRLGNRVRVTAQLIDARTDTHVWAEKYDRPLDDVFTIQSEIAERIATQLQARLSPAEKAAIAQLPTPDLAAHDLYLHAKELINTYDFARLKENLPAAVRLLDEAIARDPNFLLAHCLLARMHDDMFWNGFDPTPARLALAETAVQDALRLQPDAGEARLARGVHLYRGYRDYDGARAEFARARQALPNSAEVLLFIGSIDRRQGRWDECRRNFERAVELDPRGVYVLEQLSLCYHSLRRYEEEAAVLDRVLALTPQEPQARASRARISLDWKADTGPARTMFNRILAETPEAAADISSQEIEVAMCERDQAAATRVLAAIPEDGNNESGFLYPRAWYQALVARAWGDTTAATAALRAARVEAAKTVEARPSDPKALSVLGMIDAALGNKEEALRAGRRSCELLPPSKDAVDGADLASHLAVIYTWTGEKDLALSQLAATLRIPGNLSYGLLKLHPTWDPLRGNPRFDALVATLAPAGAARR